MGRLPPQVCDSQRAVPETQAVYYRDRLGREPVDEFIHDLRPRAAQWAMDDKCGLLNGLPPSAPPLAFPHSSQIDGELRELRCHYGRRLFRILYRRSRNLFVLLHAIEKTSGSLPAADIAVAKARFADFEARMDAPRRLPPRAVGQDAPPERHRT
jgi:phage-related protein